MRRERTSDRSSVSEPRSHSASRRSTGESFAYLFADQIDAHSTSRQRTALWPPKPKAFESATAGLPLMSSVRASLGT